MQSQPNILLTGATGFIGYHLVKSAIEKGYAVHAIVRESSQVNAIKALGVTMHYADLTKADSVKNVFETLVQQNVSPDYIIHAAALTKARSEDEFMQANCGATENILSAVKATGIRLKKFVFISSLAACGPQLIGNTIEENFNQPITLYGKSKLKAEAIVKSYSSIPYIILRPTAVYGPGEKDLFTVFKIVSKGLNPVLGFNKQELTFIYVTDLVQMILSALSTSEQNKTYFITDGSIYNKAALGDAIANSLNKKSLNMTLPLFLVKTIALASEFFSGLAKKQSALNLEKYKELTAQSWNCNVSSTFKELNYIPVYQLKEGVRETTQWYKKNKWI